ncbi:MAG: 5-formyltetrahydrofolate cyclo-ligase [Deltaproteobacteria bacterium]|jgi:5-formyltetrahydrofolate cyclo-ligase|nr:5-formyltetrahydrofolate cyclo-ligase [Deltaproteobacteria bacterium]
MGTITQAAEKSKVSLRACMRARRRALPEEEAARLSVLLQRRVLDLVLWRQARGVGLYVSARGEAGTDLLLEAAWTEGKKVFLPRVIPDRVGEMVWAGCRGREQLKLGAYGLWEPDPAQCPPALFTNEAGQGEVERPPAASAALPWPELFLLPGLAFDRQGRRLGQGGGYYDRFLAGAKPAGVFTVGLAYTFQLVDALPAAHWDQPVQAVCTENGFILCG